MTYIRGRICRSIVLKESTHLMGQVEGNIVVKAGVNLQIHGMVAGDVILEKDSEVYVHGVVTGNFVNNGGLLFIFGRVTGQIEENSGKTNIDAKAQVIEP